MTMQDSLLERALRDRREAIARAERAEAALAEVRRAVDAHRIDPATSSWNEIATYTWNVALDAVAKDIDRIAKP